MQDAFMSWIDDFIIYTRGVEEVLDRLNKFLTICHMHSVKASAK